MSFEQPSMPLSEDAAGIEKNLREAESLVGSAGFKSGEGGKNAEQSPALSPDETERVLNNLRGAESLKNALESGDPIEVKVRRSTGEVEGGWMYAGNDGQDAVVTKVGEGEKLLRKVVSLTELRELNKEADKEKEQ